MSGLPGAALGGVDHVGEEHGDGHGPDAPGDGADPAGHLTDGVEIDIADGADFPGRIGDAAGPHVDDDGALLDHVGSDEPGTARGGHEDIGGGAELAEAPGPLVAADDGGVATHEEDGDGLADDVAGAHDDAAGALEVDAGGLDHADGGEAGAGGEGAAAVDDVADVGGVDALDVFLGVDEALDAVGVDGLGQGHVDHHAHDARVVVELADFGGDALEGAVGADLVEDVLDAHLGAGSGLVVGVDTGG